MCPATFQSVETDFCSKACCEEYMIQRFGCLHCKKQFKKKRKETKFCSYACRNEHKKSPENQEQRFWSKVNKTESCWLWTASTDDCGYGILTRTLGNENERVSYKAHRLSYEMHKGEIPEGSYVCHTCDVPSCVNPDHLWLGSQKDNMVDASDKGRLGKAKGERIGLSKLTEEQVLKIRQMAGSMTQCEIANIVGVCQQTVGRVINRTLWKHI